jgi:putative oxygen-independent coproporphyrinogen III oxidase
MSAGVYISIPYCRQKCTYCNFASAARPLSELPRYLAALELEISQQAGPPFRGNVAANIQADSIYMGGGTPGLLTGAQMSSLLGTIRRAFAVSPAAEVTIEASPENVTSETAAGWASCGVNRVSLGVQSMATAELRAVGRMHDANTVVRAVENLRDAAIDNISVDLIAGLPHQTESSWEQSLSAVLDLQPPHASVYMLEVDDESRLGGELLRGGAHYSAGAVPDQDEIVEFYTRAIERLGEAGLRQYEISNFARPGRESRHNEKYWLQIPYYGFGADAHSFDGERRWANVDSLPEYLSRMAAGRSPVLEVLALEPLEKLEERLFLGLRRRQGVSCQAISSQFGKAAWATLADKMKEFYEAGWLELDGDRLRLTDRGVLFSNEVFAGLLT